MKCEICGSTNNAQNIIISYKWKGKNFNPRRALCPTCLHKYQNGTIDLRHKYIINTEQLEKEFIGSNVKLSFISDNDKLLYEGPKGKGSISREDLSYNPIEDLIAIIKSRCL